VSYFEPSRRPFARGRAGSWTALIDLLWGQPPWLRLLTALLLTLYVAAAASLCGAGLGAALLTGAVAALLVGGLVLVERTAPPLPSRIARALIPWLAMPALLVPAVVFLAIGFWLLVSLPLWLYRA
jgi:hypothetical protein